MLDNGPVRPVTIPKNAGPRQRFRRSIRPPFGPPATPHLESRGCSARSTPNAPFRSSSWRCSSAGASATSSPSRCAAARAPSSGSSTRGRRPPTAPPGSHHVLARVFKDIYPRYKTMRGYRVERKGGWDCHGLAGRDRGRAAARLHEASREIEEYGIEEFNAALPRVGVRVPRGLERADRADRLLARPRRRLPHARPDLHRVRLVGALADLRARACSTRATRSSPIARAAARRCPRTRSALGYQDVVDPTRLRQACRCSAHEESLLVWTTTPWTLPGNLAVGRRPGHHLCARVAVGEETLIVAAALVERVLRRGRAGARHAPGLRSSSAPLRAPRSSRSSDASRAARRCSPADFVTTDDGTGHRPHRARLRRGRLPPAGRERAVRPDQPARSAEPGPPRRHLRRARRSATPGARSTIRHSRRT